MKNGIFRKNKEYNIENNNIKSQILERKLEKMMNSVIIKRHDYTAIKPYLDTVKTWSFCSGNNAGINIRRKS